MAKGFILGQEPNLGDVENKIQQVDSKFSNYLPLSGGKMKGNLILNGNPTNNNQAATKQYVDSNLSKLSWTKIDTINSGSEISKNYDVTKYFIISIIANKTVTNDVSYNQIKVGLNNSTTPPKDFISFYSNNSSTDPKRDSACIVLRNNIGTSVAFIGLSTYRDYDSVVPFYSTESNYLHIKTDTKLISGTINVYGFG